MEETKWLSSYNMEDFAEPKFMEAEVVSGFGRGSKELGCPTANLNMEELQEKGESLKPGIYWGLACLPEKQIIRPMVASCGWNPFFKNEKKTIEVHLIDASPLDDFYGSRLQTLFLGYLRPELSFSSLEDLISCINSDISISRKKVQSLPPNQQMNTLADWQTLSKN